MHREQLRHITRLEDRCIGPEALTTLLATSLILTLPALMLVVLHSCAPGTARLFADYLRQLRILPSEQGCMKAKHSILRSRKSFATLSALSNKVQCARSDQTAHGSERSACQCSVCQNEKRNG